MNAQVDFPHQHAAHCESGVVSAMLTSKGFPISEAMVFGLSASLTFAYLPFIKINEMPLITFRMPPAFIIKGIQKRLGARFQFSRFRDPITAMEQLDKELGKGLSVGLQTSVYWLSYVPDDFRFHFNAHNIIAYGKNADGDYLVSDPVIEQPVVCTAKSLVKARFAKGALAPRGAQYILTSVPEQPAWQKIIKSAIARNCKIMLAPMPLVGFRGIRRLANSIRKLSNHPKGMAFEHRYLTNLVRMQEEIGTGGAGFRFLYASFLQESSELITRPELLEMSKKLTDIGDQWREIALSVVKKCRSKQRDYSSIADLLDQCADRERAFWRELKQLAKRL